MLLVFAMKCCIKMPCSLPQPLLMLASFTCVLASPAHLYMPHLFTHCLPTIICVMLMFVVFFFILYFFYFCDMLHFFVTSSPILVFIPICYESPFVKRVKKYGFSDRTQRVVRSNSCNGPVYPGNGRKKRQRAKRKFWGHQPLFGTKFVKFGPKRANLATLPLDI